MFDVGAINTLIVWRALRASDGALSDVLHRYHHASRSSDLMLELAKQLCGVDRAPLAGTSHSAKPSPATAPANAYGSHALRESKTKGRCKYLPNHGDSRSRTKYYCAGCDVPLCIRCHAPFHDALDAAMAE